MATTAISWRKLLFELFSDGRQYTLEEIIPVMRWRLSEFKFEIYGKVAIVLDANAEGDLFYGVEAMRVLKFPASTMESGMMQERQRRYVEAIFKDLMKTGDRHGELVSHSLDRPLFVKRGTYSP